MDTHLAYYCQPHKSAANFNPIPPRRASPHGAQDQTRRGEAGGGRGLRRRGALPAGELDDAGALGEGDVADAEDGEDAAHGGGGRRDLRAGEL